jgi:LPXTG-motif cell wall-anchored protein
VQKKHIFGGIVLVITLLMISFGNTKAAFAETYDGVRNVEKIMEVKPRGNPTETKDIENRTYTHSAYEATGIFLYKGEELEIVMDEEPEDLQLRVGQWGTYENVPYLTDVSNIFGNGTRTITRGTTRFSREDTGGMVYLVNYSKTKTETVKIRGGVKVPHFIDGITTDEEFIEQLTTYKDVPFMQIESDWVLATVRIDRAEDIMLKKGQARKFINMASKTAKIVSEVSGFSREGIGLNKKSPQRIHIENPTTGAGGLYASNNYLGIHSKSTKDRAIFNTSGNYPEWGLSHEMGHTYQDKNYKWSNMGEVTVNIFAVYVQKFWDEGATDRYDAVNSSNGARKSVKRLFDQMEADPTFTFDEDPIREKSDYHFADLGLFITLPRVFGYDFYRILSQNYRALPESEKPGNDLEKKQQFVIMTSLTAKRNLLPYFDRWRFTITDETREKVEALNLPPLEKEIWKDIFATEEEEKAGTYRILDSMSSYTVPVGELKETTMTVPFEDIFNTKVLSTAVNRVYSMPIDSSTWIVSGDALPVGLNFGEGQGVINLQNEASVNNKLMFPVNVTAGNTYVMSGQKGRYAILGYDSSAKKLVSKGSSDKILQNLPNNTYPKIKIYDKSMSTVKKEVVGLGSNFGTDISNALNGFSVEVGDIIELYHKESSKRVSRYKDGEKLTTNKDTYYYKVLDNYWIEVDDPNDQTLIQVKDTTITAGDTWKASDNLVSATDKDGKSLTADELTIEGMVDINVPGEYEIKYTNDTLTEIAKVTVLEDQSSIEVKDSSVVVGDSWTAADNFVGATDKNGHKIDLTELTVEDTVDMTQPGEYKVIFTYRNVKETAKVTVVADQTSLEVKDTSVVIGDSWTAADNFVSATDKYGQPVTLVAIEVIGVVDTTQSNEYSITYKNGTIEKTVKVTVHADLTSLKVKNLNLTIGDSWTAADNFVSATDKNGNEILLDDVTVEGSVDTSQLGEYEIKYTNGALTEVAKVTVSKQVINQSSLVVKDSTITIGASWTAADNFVSATDQDGNQLALEALEVTGSVDTSTPGDYRVVYRNGQLEETAKVTVLPAKIDLSTLKVKNTLLTVGHKWTAADNFVSATDQDGKQLTLEDIQVEGSVDSTQPGMHNITFTNGELKEIATVTVIPAVIDRTSLEVQDVTLIVGETWLPDLGLVSATNEEGKAFSSADLIIEGTVDTNHIGTYNVTYKNGALHKTIVVSVVAARNDQLNEEKEDKISDSQTNADFTAEEQTKEYHSAKKLPATGEKANYFVLLLGLLAILFSSQKLKQLAKSTNENE